MITAWRDVEPGDILEGAGFSADHYIDVVLHVKRNGFARNMHVTLLSLDTGVVWSLVTTEGWKVKRL